MSPRFWSWQKISAIALVVTAELLSALSLPTAHADSDTRWIADADRRIEANRKGSLRVLVLDREGSPVPRCKLKITMTRHAFAFGVRLNAKAIEQSPSDENHATSPVWRAFNTLSMDDVTSWPKVQPEVDRWDFKQVDTFLDWAKKRQIKPTWGSLISEDRGRLPAWAASLSAAELKNAIDTHSQKVFDRYGKAITHLHVFTNTLDRRYVTQNLGVAMQRQLYHATRERRINATAAFDDAFRPDRLTGMVRRVTRMREDFIPFDSVAVGATFRDSANPHRFLRSLAVMGNLKLDIIVNNLEVGGTNDSDAAQNLSKILRAAFADPNVKGITFAGLFADELNEPSAALLEKSGEPTAAGLVFDQLITNVWWTQVEESTGPLGNVRVRVFAGDHDLTATLPDGTVVKSTMRVQQGDKEQLVVLQPVLPEKPSDESDDGDEEDESKNQQRNQLTEVETP